MLRKLLNFLFGNRSFHTYYRDYILVLFDSCTSNDKANSTHGYIGATIPSNELMFRQDNERIESGRVGKVRQFDRCVERIFLIDEKRNLMSFKERFFDQLSRELQLILLDQHIIALSLLISFLFHSVLTNVIYFYHQPGERLTDLGYALVPELSKYWRSLGDYIMILIVFIFVSFLLSPFFVRKNFSDYGGNSLIRPFFSFIMLSRFGVSTSICVLLRCLSFMVTVLPSPAAHCLPNSTEYQPPQSLQEIFFRVDAQSGCGDLIFSSHTLIALNCALTINYYSRKSQLKISIQSLCAFLSLLIIAARHHYTVDVVIAQYVVPLVWNQLLRQRSDLPYPLLNGDLLDSKNWSLLGQDHQISQKFFDKQGSESSSLSPQLNDEEQNNLETSNSIDKISSSISTSISTNPYPSSSSSNCSNNGSRSPSVLSSRSNYEPSKNRRIEILV